MAIANFVTAPRKGPPPRIWKPQEFRLHYDQLIARDEFQFGSHLGSRKYQLRYITRYRYCLQRFAELAPRGPLDVLDIGGGQLALMCNRLWGDRATVADLPGEHMQYMRRQGVSVKLWHLVDDREAPFSRGEQFDCIFFSEVIEHLPIPAYLVLEKLRQLLKPGGVLICTTPNFFRVRNLVLMLAGRDPWDHWRYDSEHALGHINEFSKQRLAWQFERAGFSRCDIELVHMGHALSTPFLRPFGFLGHALYWIPRFRDNLVAVARP